MQSFEFCHQCGVGVIKHLQKHKETKCSKRLIQCECCQEITPHDIWIGKHGKECEEYKAKCRFCQTRYYNKEMCNHLLQCPVVSELLLGVYNYKPDDRFLEEVGIAKHYRLANRLGEPTRKVFANKVERIVNRNCLGYLFISIKQFQIPDLLNLVSSELSRMNISRSFLFECKKFLGDELTLGFLQSLIKVLKLCDRGYDKLDEKFGYQEVDDYQSFRLDRFYVHYEDKDIFFDIITKKRCKNRFIKNLREELTTLLNCNLPNTILRYLFDEYIIQ